MAAVRTPYISGMLQCIPTIYPTERISVSKIYFRRWRRQFNEASVYRAWKQQDSPTQFWTHIFHTLKINFRSVIRRAPKIAKSDYQLCHVCPSVRPVAWNNSAPTGRISTKPDIWELFWKSVKKIQVSVKSNNINGYFTRRLTYIFYHTSFFSSWDEKCFI